MCVGMIESVIFREFDFKMEPYFFFTVRVHRVVVQILKVDARNFFFFFKIPTEDMAKSVSTYIVILKL